MINTALIDFRIKLSDRVSDRKGMGQSKEKVMAINGNLMEGVKKTTSRSTAK